MSEPQFFTEEEKDALQELMNIAFGQAAADFSDIINIPINLSFPEVNTLRTPDIKPYISEFYCNKCNVVEQSFRGTAGGVAYLVLPSGSEKHFMSMFRLDGAVKPELMLMDMEQEVLSEVGNILIGACVSSIFELLKSGISYSPPQTVLNTEFSDHFISRRFSGDDVSVILKTGFSFDKMPLEGHLFLINTQNSVIPLKNALTEFLSSYE